MPCEPNSLMLFPIWGTAKTFIGVSRPADVERKDCGIEAAKRRNSQAALTLPRPEAPLSRERGLEEPALSEAKGPSRLRGPGHTRCPPHWIILRGPLPSARGASG
jgi:hypothetical protein